MKRVLITGADSYIGRSFMTHVSNDHRLEVTELDVRDESWKDHDFSGYDTVFHVAGIAHFSKDESQKDLYYHVNTELTETVAKVAKSHSVPHFVFMSSIIVYGDSTAKERVITVATPPSPSDFYGDSKWQAEQRLNALSDERFSVAIIRPPMIYGKGSKGNYPRLSRLAQKTPVFPRINNQRSMLHIDNFSEFVKQLILTKRTGVFFPQNKEYVCTSELVREIAKQHGKQIYLTSVANPLIRLLFRLDSVKKLFGNLVYEQSMSQYEFDYQVRSFEESIRVTEECEK